MTTRALTILNETGDVTIAWDALPISIQAVRTQVWGRDGRRLDPFIDELMEKALRNVEEAAVAA